MNLSRLYNVFNAEKAKVSLVGAVVVDTNDVGFYTFRANCNEVLKSHQVAVKDLDTSREGWSEQDPMTMLRAVDECIFNTTSPGGMVMGTRVVAVGIANNRGSVVAWNRRTGEPLCNVILWSDSRAAAMVDEYLRTNDKYRFQGVCGLPFSPYFSAFKIKWLLVNNVKVMSAYRSGDCYFGTIDSWLLWNITGGKNGGVFATDSSNASYTFLMNINTLKWDKLLLKFFGISEKFLPTIKTSSEVFGNIFEGHLIDTPVSGIIGNRQAALIGQKCFRSGLTKGILDKSGSIFTITGEDKVFSKNGLLTTIAYRLDSRPIFALEGPIASAGYTIDWVKKCLNVKETECLALKTKDKLQNEVYLVPAFNGLYAPHWRHEARSVLVGANEFTVNDDILKAAMKSVCFQTQDIVEALNDDLKMSIDKIQIDGYLSDDGLIMQYLSDITNSQIEVAKYKNGVALGAAMAAGYAPEINVWNALCMPGDNGVIYQPKMTVDERKIRLFDWRRALRRSYDWIDYNNSLDHFWLTVSITSGVIFLGGYLILKK
ncbi:glycerol kinase-like [Acyrthosiphon pisum]|uniref:Glycerol kinase n=1 Tax=Acyrthosiphon pisum TaxID=7029 RepID=A0A8R2A556_ACYPI|nr:glycerol kinase-like [Acyrthosiphon pisum]|eukprot:XP_001946651.2 PREDICTED: glycerol kinase-like [Acyrthosiphon pisum]